MTVRSGIGLIGKLATALGRGVGDTITLRLGDGTKTDVRVVAVVSQRAGFERVLLPAEFLAPHTTIGLAPQLLVRAASGVDTATLTSRLRDATADLPVQVGDRDSLIAAHAKGNEVGAWVNYLLAGMIAAYTVISVVNTLVMATARRRREFGLQRLSGFTRSQVLRMAGIEGGLIATIGIVLGTVVAAAALVPFCLVVSGSPVPSGPIGASAQAEVVLAEDVAVFEAFLFDGLARARVPVHDGRDTDDVRTRFA